MTDFSATKAMFHLPADIIYLDGNSLGPLPKAATANVANCMQAEWGEMLIKGWNEASWMAQPTILGDRVGALIGAEKGSVVLGDTLSIKVYQALASALELNPDRKVILSDNGNFPTDLYMAEGLIKSLDKSHELKIVNPTDIEAALDESVAVLMITEVDYKTGRKHDMAKLTKLAHEKGIITIWDLAHSAGALPVELAKVNADFAIGCTYKYLNGGPGAPAFIYVAPRLSDKIQPALSGWLGHDAPFAFDLEYRAGAGIERMRVGTPPIIQLASLKAALDVWDHANMADIRKKSVELCDLFISEIEKRCPSLTLDSPRDGNVRGSQISFRFEHGYAAMQAIIDHGVIGDFRAPDTMRFGFTPLYVDEADVLKACDIIEKVITQEIWDQDKYKVRNKVT